MVTVQIGNRTYPVVRSPKCKICTHPARVQIEEKLLLGEQYGQIVSFVSGRSYAEVDGTRIDWPEITNRQIMNHYNHGHCPVDTGLLKQFTQEREQELGIRYDETVGRVVDEVIVAKLVLARGQERLAKGEIEPTVKETLVAAKLIHDINAGQSADEADQTSAYVAAFEVYFTVAKEVMSPEQFRDFGARLYSNPILRELAAKMQDDSDIQDAEIVETTPPLPLAKEAS